MTKKLLKLMGAGLTVNGDEVMVGDNDAKFGEKTRFRNLVVGDKKGKKAEGREMRGGGGEYDDNSITMDADFYQRDVYDDYTSSYVFF